MAKYYIANSLFEPYKYEELYKAARELTDAHKAEAAKYGALDVAAADVEANLDPEKDKELYEAVQSYRKNLDNAVSDLNSRGLSGNVYNNVMKLASSYASGVKPAEEAVANYKKIMVARANKEATDPNFIPRYATDQISVTDNLRTPSEKALAGIQGDLYLKDITTAIEKLTSDINMHKWNGANVFGKDLYELYLHGLTPKQALGEILNKPEYQDEKSQELIKAALDTINGKYDISSFVATNPGILPRIEQIENQGIINAIRTPELKDFTNSIGYSAGRSRSSGPVYINNGPVGTQPSVTGNSPVTPIMAASDKVMEARSNSALQRYANNPYEYAKALIDVNNYRYNEKDTANVNGKRMGDLMTSSFMQTYKNKYSSLGKGFFKHSLYYWKTAIIDPNNTKAFAALADHLGLPEKATREQVREKFTSLLSDIANYTIGSHENAMLGLRSQQIPVSSAMAMIDIASVDQIKPAKVSSVTFDKDKTDTLDKLRTANDVFIYFCPEGYFSNKNATSNSLIMRFNGDKEMYIPISKLNMDMQDKKSLDAIFKEIKWRNKLGGSGYNGIPYWLDSETRRTLEETINNILESYAATIQQAYPPTDAKTGIVVEDKTKEKKKK